MRATRWLRGSSGRHRPPGQGDAGPREGPGGEGDGDDLAPIERLASPRSPRDQSGARCHPHLATLRPRPTLAPTVAWGLLVGAVTAAMPLALWWLDPAAADALAITLIASVYIGFAVADGRARVIAIEVTESAGFR